MYQYSVSFNDRSPPPLRRVSIFNFVNTHPTINVCLCCRRPVPNIPPRIPDRPYSGRLNWASPTQQQRTRQQPVQDAPMTVRNSIRRGLVLNDGLWQTGCVAGQSWRKKSSFTHWGQEDLLKRAFRPMYYSDLNGLDIELLTFADRDRNYVE